LTTANRRRSNL